MATDADKLPLSDLAILPGELLEEELEAAGMTQTEFASRTELSSDLVADIVSGTRPITAEIASRIEATLGVPAHLWLNLEARYRSTLARYPKR